MISAIEGITGIFRKGLTNTTNIVVAILIILGITIAIAGFLGVAFTISALLLMLVNKIAILIYAPIPWLGFWKCAGIGVIITIFKMLFIRARSSSD